MNIFSLTSYEPDSRRQIIEEVFENIEYPPGWSAALDIIREYGLILDKACELNAPKGWKIYQREDEGTTDSGGLYIKVYGQSKKEDGYLYFYFFPNGDFNNCDIRDE